MGRISGVFARRLFVLHIICLDRMLLLLDRTGCPKSELLVFVRRVLVPCILSVHPHRDGYPDNICCTLLGQCCCGLSRLSRHPSKDGTNRIANSTDVETFRAPQCCCYACDCFIRDNYYYLFSLLNPTYCAVRHLSARVKPKMDKLHSRTWIWRR
jgi:hypothetical protein